MALYMAAIQVNDTYRTWDDAYQALRAQEAQEEYCGGRIYLKDRAWRLQAFFPSDGLAQTAWLPDGMRRVIVLPAMLRMLEIEGV